MNDLSMTSTVSENVTTVRFDGRMDAEGTRAISEEFDRLTSGSAPVLVDLSRVGFMESLGVALLVRLAKRLRDVRSTVAVVPSQSVARILGSARLDRILKVAFTEEDALVMLGVA